MSARAELKNASLQRILNASAARLRQEGLSGAAVAAVMLDAGLTHGAFYCHFANKEDLAIAALRHALKDNRRRWVGSARRESWLDRLTRLGRRYLTPAHRDDLADSCALAALASDAARSGPAFKAAYQEEALKSLRAICAAADDDDRTIDPARFDDAIAFLALCIGGMSLARAVNDKAFSDRILAACRQAVGSLTAPLPPEPPTAEPTDDPNS
ncbi:MAG: TetR/AcrR family transcriptional regulator [Defluviicoccus sp.]|nr:TetR/AcrR family transcriptional regulator [Defluviicoccus sp.]MDS4073245.1 TetR/AcrR family transcriptional regulator [Defluviicoccus sp.]